MDSGITNEKISFWYFRFSPSSEMKIEALTGHLKNERSVKTVYLLNQKYTHDQQVTKGSRVHLSERRPGIEIAAEDFVPIGSVREYAPDVVRSATLGGDTVLISNWRSDLALFLKASWEFGLNSRI